MSWDIEEGAKALEQFLRREPATPLRWRSEVLGEAPDRLVVQYSCYRDDAPSGSDPFLYLIGKFYADDAGQRTYAIMRTLDQTLSRASAPPLLAVPRTLFYESHRRLLVQQRVEGTPYGELLNGNDARDYLGLAGKALAFLHDLDIPAGEEKGMGDHLQELIHPHPRELEQQMSRHRSLVGGLIEALEEAERAWKGDIDAAPLHRDFHLRQLFYGQQRVWLIDWDLFGRGDPALDVGNFLVYLKTHLTQHSASSIAAFLEGYFANRSSSILKRVPFYEAFTYLRLACNRVRLKGERWEDAVKAMLLHSERCLAEESTYGRA